MIDEQAAQLIEQNKMLLQKVAVLEEELQLQKDLVAALLKRLYGAKSEKLSHDQLLLTFLEDEAKNPEVADGNEEPPAAEQKSKKPRAKRTNKLSDSLKGLPTIERIIIAPEVRKNPDLFRLNTTFLLRIKLLEKTINEPRAFYPPPCREVHRCPC